ncbi:HNH endonuclease family protein [Streptomyces sp. NPDC001941]|uniref:HNH endonuclease family protein n=1 Tax=Streptomyces sp. NPDC001941 TaxID=3154659 RepID=UPI00331B213D
MSRQRWITTGLLGTVLALAATGCSGTLEQGTGADGKGAATGPPASSAAPGGAGGAPNGVKALPGIPAPAQARTELAGLKVAPAGSMSGYSRAKFPHWASQGENCDTRETVLDRDGSGVERDGQCKAVTGTWVSRYDGVTVTKASGMDIDHTVPLANAWRSGAAAWTTEQRKAFANDLTHPQLVAVTAKTNRTKGDQSPDQWAPPSKGYWCAYAESWTSVKSTYKLTVTQAEKDKLTEMLGTCTG